MTSDEYVCPVCKQAVDTVVRRHKTLGVFVPLWGAGPCQNPKCAEYEEGEGEAEQAEAASESVLASDPGPPEVQPGTRAPGTRGPGPCGPGVRGAGFLSAAAREK